MQAVVGRRALEKQAAGANTLSRFETDFSQGVDEPGVGVPAHSPHQRIILDMDSSSKGRRYGLPLSVIIDGKVEGSATCTAPMESRPGMNGCSPSLPSRAAVYECLEAHSFLYAIRLPANDVVQREIDFLLTRPVGRPPKRPIIFYYDFRYQAGSSSRRVVAKVEWHSGELFPRSDSLSEPDGSKTEAPSNGSRKASP